MDKIIILDEALINKIAAGEVIESPASIVKELIENSIDAKARKISVEVREGGKSYIRVTDDGLGMSKRDSELSWQRHATSKIKDASDLFSIKTLGFRGEALASIASVSELTITTREEGNITGNRITINAGIEAQNEEIGCPKGTTIEVKNLFFNTPARKKYLKSMETELAKITDIVTRFSLVYHDIQFRLSHNTKELFNWPASDKLARISQIYGKRTANDLAEIHYEDQNYKITGFVSKPTLSKSSKEDQSIYVNKRYIKKNSPITNGLNDAFHTMMMVNRYPVAIINIDILPERTDVNVHPQKAEIRVQDEKELYQAVFDAVKLSLKDHDLVPEALGDSRKKITDFISQKYEKAYPVEADEQQLLAKESESTATEKIPLIVVLGVVNKTYILAETDGNLLLVDQHAAAERILYEKFTEELKEKKVKVQRLLNPEILEVSPKQFHTANEKKDKLEGLGYDVEPFGQNTIKLSSIPIILGRQFNNTIFMDFLDELGADDKIESLELFFHKRIARMSCRTAIKAGDEITLPQVKEYIVNILKKNFPPTCPHGRPIMIKWSFYELEKMFKRVV